MLYLIAFVLAPVLAAFYEEPVITSLIRWLGLSFTISSFRDVPLALLEKEIQFKKGAIPEMVSLSIYSIISVILVWYGYSYWGMVYGQLIAEAASVIVAWSLISWRPTFRFSKEVAREMIGYGKHIFGSNLIVFINRNIDDILIGKMLGMGTLGYYNFAYRISSIPATNITSVIVRVIFPIYAKLPKKPIRSTQRSAQDDPLFRDD